jgi:hypothetical protein
MKTNLGFICGILGCVAVLAGALAGCASVTAIPVDPKTGQAVPGAVPGVRYYMPSPYLLVTEVPNDPSAGPKGAGGAGGGPAPAAPAPATPTDKKAADDSSGASPSPTTDTSFSMFTKQYGIKLIYLPDYSRPMVLQQSAGIGSTTMKPTLQNGWMLTTLDSSADSKVAETLSSVASIIGATHGGSGGSGGSKSGGAAGGGAAGEAPVPPVLPPGLYRLYFDPSTGVLTKLCKVARFNQNGIEDPEIAQRCP